MASSRNENQILWSTNSSVSVTSATAVTSDAFMFNVEDWEAMLQVYVDNAGTPASGDVCNVYIAYTTGDILGDTGSDYATTEHAQPLGQLDTFGTNTPGEDPASAVYRISTAALGFKVIVTCPNATTHNMTVRARVVTHRPQ